PLIRLLSFLKKTDHVLMTGVLESYYTQPGVWDELMSRNGVRESYHQVVKAIASLSAEEMENKDELAKKLFMTQGITFTVYSDNEGVEKIFPFDIIPRIIEAKEWSIIETGVK